MEVPSPSSKVEGQRGAPVTPDSRPQDPEQPVERGQFRIFSCGPLKHADMVAQSGVLELKDGARTEVRRQSGKECSEGD